MNNQDIQFLQSNFFMYAMNLTTLVMPYRPDFVQSYGITQCYKYP